MNHRTPASATPIHLVAGIPVSSLKIMYLISHHWSRGLHHCNSRTIDHAINKNESMNETTNVGGISNDIAPKPRNRITYIRNECQTPGIVDLIFMGTFFFAFFFFSENMNVGYHWELHVSVTRSGIVPAFRTLLLPDVVLDDARRVIGTLADLPAIEVFEPRTQRAVHVMVLSGKAVLSMVAEWVELVSPVAIKVEPLCGGVRAGGRGAQSVVVVVVGVRMAVEQRIPEWTAVGLVMEKTPWQDVVVHAWSGVHGVRAHGGVNDGLKLGLASGLRGFCR